MTDGSRIPGRPKEASPQARQESQASGAKQEGESEEVDPYVAERTSAQSRKIDLSMARKAGYAPSADPQDKAMQGSEQRRTDNRYNPRKW